MFESEKQLLFFSLSYLFSIYSLYLLSKLFIERKISVSEFLTCSSNKWIASCGDGIGRDRIAHWEGTFKDDQVQPPDHFRLKRINESIAQMASECWQAWGISTSLGNTGLVFCHPHGKYIFF